MDNLISFGLFADVFIRSGGTVSVGGSFTNGSFLEFRGNGCTIEGELINNGTIELPFGSAFVEDDFTNDGNSDINGIITVNGSFQGSKAFRGEGGTTFFKRPV